MMLFIITPVTECPIDANVAELSPSHLEPYLPIPAKELLEVIIGLLSCPVNHAAEAFTYNVPKREWASSSVTSTSTSNPFL